MFLALTADDRFWEKDGEVLFLGEWCLLYGGSTPGTRPAGRVLEHPWDDRQKLRSDYEYLNGVYESCLAALAAALNLLHGRSHGMRYWRILVGPWLYQYIQVLFERFLCLSAAARTGKSLQTSLPPEAAHIVPRDFAHFSSLFTEDDYNLVLYSRLVRRMGKIAFRVREDVPFPSRPAVAAGVDGLARRLKRWLQKAALAWGRGNAVALVGAYFPLRASASLHARLRQFPIHDVPDALPSLPPADAARRGALRVDLGSGEFERLLAQTVAQDMPLAYLEGYELCRRRAAGLFPRAPRAILTANGAIGKDLFKFWAAEKTEAGAVLGILQHGGHYGAGQWNSNERHETLVADAYFSWGWDSPENPRVRPLPASKLAGLGPLKSRGGGPLLWVLMSMPRYTYWMYSVPVGPQNVGYWADQIRFALALGEPARRILRCRLYAKDTGWRESARLQDAVPGLVFDDSGASMESSLANSRLFIGTYDSTTFLETLARDFPTVLFWNPRHWELRPSAEPFYEDLRRAGILHATPEAAAAKVNAILDSPQAWWRGAEVQAARQRFCRRFARTEGGWIDRWANEIEMFARKGSVQLCKT